MKLGQIYNLKSFDSFVKSGQYFDTSARFGDASAGLVIKENLKAVDPKIFEVQYPELAFVNSGIEVNNFGGDALAIQSLRTRPQGRYSKSNNRDDALGKITMAGDQSTIKTSAYNSHSLWTTQEIRQAELQGINLPNEFLKAHNQIFLQEIDEIGLIGRDGNTGLLNFAGFTSGAAGNTAQNLTGELLYDAIANLIVNQWNTVNNTPAYKANRVIMPVDVMNETQKKVYKPEASTDTVLTALRKNFPTVEFLATFRGSDTSPTSTVAFSNSPEAMLFRLPRPLEISNVVQQAGFSFRVDSMYTVAGLDVLESTAGRILTGL